MRSYEGIRSTLLLVLFNYLLFPSWMINSSVSAFAPISPTTNSHLSSVQHKGDIPNIHNVGKLPNSSLIYARKASTQLQAFAGYEQIQQLAKTSKLSTLFSSASTIPLIPSLLLNSSLFLLLRSKLNKMLTPQGFVHSLYLGTLLWHTLGWKGWTTCVLYLFLGQAVTKVKFEEKAKKGIAEGRGGRRGPENVWGSAATGLLCAIASARIHPSLVTSTSTFLGLTYDQYMLGYVASLATKLSDTFASEIGKAYGKTCFLITTFERVKPGEEGAISVEGTLASLVGGSLLPIYAYTIGLTNTLTGVGIATVSAFVATLVESLLGATIQGKKGLEWISNEVVNFFNTVIGATLAISFQKCLANGSPWIFIRNWSLSALLFKLVFMKDEKGTNSA